jgi:hypothetical protein
MPPSHGKFHALAFCLLIVAACYANSLPDSFIQDDHLIVAGNKAIHTITPLDFLAQPYWPATMTGGTYRPLTIFTFSIDRALWGPWAPGFRVTNLLLHTLNGWLVFLLARSLLGGGPAWAAAAVYLAHPVHTEAVVGIVGTSDCWLVGVPGKNRRGRGCLP